MSPTANWNDETGAKSHADPDSWDALSPEARAAWLRGMDEADQEYEHHADCDHWRVAHKTVYGQVSREGRGLWQAHCEEPDCSWTSDLMGPDGRSSIARQEQEHGNVWTQCVGECSTWDDPTQIERSENENG